MNSDMWSFFKYYLKILAYFKITYVLTNLRSPIFGFCCEHLLLKDYSHFFFLNITILNTVGNKALIWLLRVNDWFSKLSFAIQYKILPAGINFTCFFSSLFAHGQYASVEANWV